MPAVVPSAWRVWSVWSTKLQLTSRRRLQSPEAKPVRRGSWPGWRSAEAPLRAGPGFGSEGPVAGHTAAAAAAAGEERKSPRRPGENVCCCSFGGEPADQRRLKVRIHVVLLLMTFHDAVLKWNSSRGSFGAEDRRLRFIHSDQLEPQRRGALYPRSDPEEPLGAPAHREADTPGEVRGSVQLQVGRGGRHRVNQHQ